MITALLWVGLAGATELQEWTLDDGTEVVLATDGRVPTVTVEFSFGAGTLHEGFETLDETLSLALYDTEGELRRRADALGVDVRFSAGGLTSTLRVTSLAEDLPQVQELLADLLRENDLDADQAARDRRSIALAWATQQREPGFRRGQQVTRLFHAPDDPRRAPVEQPVHLSLDMADHVALRDTVVALPGRRVGIAGAVERAQVESMLAAVLPPVQGEALPLPELPDLLEPTEREVRVELAKLTQTYFAMARTAPGRDDADHPALRVAGHVLGGHFYSRLYEELRHEDGDTYGASASVPGGHWPGLLTMTTFTQADNTDVAREKLLAAVTRFQADGMTAEELADAQGHFHGRLAFYRQTPMQAVRQRISERFWGEEPGWLERDDDAIQALTLDEVNAVIGRWFDPADFVLVEVGPKD